MPAGVTHRARSARWRSGRRSGAAGLQHHLRGLIRGDGRGRGGTGRDELRGGFVVAVEVDHVGAGEDVGEADRVGRAEPLAVDDLHHLRAASSGGLEPDPPRGRPVARGVEPHEDHAVDRDDEARALHRDVVLDGVALAADVGLEGDARERQLREAHDASGVRFSPPEVSLRPHDGPHARDVRPDRDAGDRAPLRILDAERDGAAALEPDRDLGAVGGHDHGVVLVGREALALHAEARALGVDVRDLEGSVVAGHHRERHRVGGTERDERADDPAAARVRDAAAQRTARELEPELDRPGLRRAERDRGLGEVPAGPVDHPHRERHVGRDSGHEDFASRVRVELHLDSVRTRG